MEWRQMVINIYEKTSQVLTKALEGLDQNDLDQQPKPDCNSIGWLAWHMTRVQDRATAHLAMEEQLWVKEGWHNKFNRPPDPQDFGLGHGLKDLAAFRSPNVQTILGYHSAVLQRSKRYIGNLSETDLDRSLDHPRFPTVGARLMAVISDNLQHAGQVAYLHGLLKGKGWLDV